MFFTVPSLKLTANAPENKLSQKESNLPTIHFQVRTVSFREGMRWCSWKTSMAHSWKVCHPTDFPPKSSSKSAKCYGMATLTQNAPSNNKYPWRSTHKTQKAQKMRVVENNARTWDSSYMFLHICFFVKPQYVPFHIPFFGGEITINQEAKLHLDFDTLLVDKST